MNDEKQEPRNKILDYDWIRFNDPGFIVRKDSVVRYLVPPGRGQGDKPLVRMGTITDIFHKNYMTFAKIKDASDSDEREVLLQSIYEVKKIEPPQS